MYPSSDITVDLEQGAGHNTVLKAVDSYIIVAGKLEITYRSRKRETVRYGGQGEGRQ